MAEKQLRNALSIGQGDWSLFVKQPISATILAMTVGVVVIPRLLRWHANRGTARNEADNAA